MSERTREFGIRLAVGSEPRRLLKGVIAEGAVMAAARVLAGAAFGFVLARKIFPGCQDVGHIVGVCLCVRAGGGRGYRVGAARVEVLQALRSE